MSKTALTLFSIFTFFISFSESAERLFTAGSATTETVFKKDIIEETFCCRVNVYHDACTNCPYIVIVPDTTQPFTQPSLKTVNL